MAFRKAERKKAKMRIGLVGPAGSGKTYGALLIAFGLGEKIAMIDTENGSGDLYSSLGEYDVCTISAPYTVEKYLAAMKEAEDVGYDVLIIDSLSHAWAGEGGLLDQQGKIADSGRKNGYAAWRDVTPLHNRLVEAILTSPCHIIATMRSKTEYVLQENERGKMEPKKVGMAPVQREGMDYEFGLVFDLAHNHSAKASKDRTSLFDGQIMTLSMSIGEKLREWMEGGVEVITVAARRQIWEWYLEHFKHDAGRAKEEILRLTEGRGSNDWTHEDIKVLEAAKKELLDEASVEGKNADDEPGIDLDEPAPSEVGEPREGDAESGEKAHGQRSLGLLDELKALLTGEDGLGLTNGDLDEFIYTQVKKVSLSELTITDMGKVKRAAMKELEKRRAKNEQ